MEAFPRLSADRRRAVTVEAVITLAGIQNPNEITTAAIAEYMHVTQGSLFRHFPNKEAIWQAVMEWVAVTLLYEIDRSVEGIDSPVAAMEAIFTCHIGFIIAHPGVPRIIFGELQRSGPTPAKETVGMLLRHYGERLLRLIERGKACGELAADLDSECAATLFIGTIQGLLMQSMLAGDINRMQRDAPRAFSLYRRGIGK